MVASLVAARGGEGRAGRGATRERTAALTCVRAGALVGLGECARNPRGRVGRRARDVGLGQAMQGMSPWLSRGD